jgi:hypothetical protein
MKGTVMASGEIKPANDQGQNLETQTPQTSLPKQSSGQKSIDWVAPFCWIWDHTDSLTKWAQVAALIVGGVWAYRRFARVDQPSLEPTARLELHVDEHPFDSPDSCRVDFRVTVHNDGHVPFDVKRLQIGGWHSDPPQPTADTPAYFNVDAMEHGKPVLAMGVPSDLVLNRHYPPNSALDQSFTYVFKQLKGLNVFRFEIYDNTDPKAKPLAFARDWNLWDCPRPRPKNSP